MNNNKVESHHGLPFCQGSMDTVIQSLVTTQESERAPPLPYKRLIDGWHVRVCLLGGDPRRYKKGN